MSTIASSGSCSATAASSVSDSPTRATTSSPASSSIAASPSRKRTPSSATTTRMGAPSRFGSRARAGCAAAACRRVPRRGQADPGAHCRPDPGPADTVIAADEAQGAVLAPRLHLHARGEACLTALVIASQATKYAAASTAAGRTGPTARGWRSSRLASRIATVRGSWARCDGGSGKWMRSLDLFVEGIATINDVMAGLIKDGDQPATVAKVIVAAATDPLTSPLLQAVRRWKGTRAVYGWFGGLPRAGKSRSSARKSGGVPLTARCAVSGQPVRCVWGIRSVTRPAVTWDVIEIQPAHQYQGGHPKLPKSVERGRVRFIVATSSQPR